MSKEDEVMKQIAELTKQVSELKKIDLDAVFANSKKKTGRTSSGKESNDSRPTRPKPNEKPDWVKDWNRRHASHGRTQTIVKTTEVYHQDGKVDVKTELLQPVALPDHLRLGKLHNEPASLVRWDAPTSDAVPPRGLTATELRAWDAANPGNPLNLRDEGPTKPMRKQRLGMEKVWKYRNFRYCLHCSEFYSEAEAEAMGDPEMAGKLKKGVFDTWESRTDPYATQLGVRPTHAQIWCYNCGCVEDEVSLSVPSHIGSWAPPKELPKEKAKRLERQAYRRSRTIYSLVEAPKTAQQLCIWFREVEHYEGVDFIMIELMLHKMRKEGLVIYQDAQWWEMEDYLFEHPESE